jgi:hypothetical protein
MRRLIWSPCKSWSQRLIIGSCQTPPYIHSGVEHLGMCMYWCQKACCAVDSMEPESLQLPWVHLFLRGVSRRAGKNLQAQYERWQPRAKYKMHLDPTMDDVKKLAVSCRRGAKVGLSPLFSSTIWKTRHVAFPLGEGEVEPTTWKHGRDVQPCVRPRTP